MPQEILRVGIYIRVSTDEQATSGFSLEGQYSHIRAHITQNPNWRVVRVYRDNGQSGANLERPGLQQMLFQAKMGLFDSLLVWRYDRLSRDNQDFQSILHYLYNNGIKVISTTEPTPDYDTPYGEFSISLIGLMSTLERKILKMRTRMGQETRVKKKMHHGGYAPLGYDYDKEKGKLIINKEGAKIVKTIFKKYIEYQTLNQVANYLMNNNILTPKGKKVWKTRVIRYILERRTYLGYYISGDLEVQDKFIQIIDDDTFNKTQEILGARSKYSPNFNGRYSRMHLTHLDGEKLNDLTENPYLKQYVQDKMDMPECPECNEPWKVRHDGKFITKENIEVPYYFCNKCKKKFHAPYSSIVSRLYYPNCPRCGEKDKIKACGKEKRTAGKIYQCYSCQSCNHWYKVEEDNQEYMDAIRNIARGLKRH